jgi:hypothetical protein
MILEQQDTITPYNLGDGLRLRFATVDDIEALAQFNGRIHGNEGFNAFVAQWTREFAAPSHPTCGPDNVTLVEDTTTGQIVSSMCLIPQVDVGWIPLQSTAEAVNGSRLSAAWSGSGAD